MLLWLYYKSDSSISTIGLQPAGRDPERKSVWYEEWEQKTAEYSNFALNRLEIHGCESTGECLVIAIINHHKGTKVTAMTRVYMQNIL